MKTLLSSTDTTATYEFTHGSAVKQITFQKTPDRQDLEQVAEQEHADWLSWLGVTE